VNEFLRNYGVEPVALGDLAGEVKRGLAASHASLHPSRTRLYLLARILVSSLRLAKDLRTHLTDNWARDHLDTILIERAWRR
jgi:hypothetical protein